MVQDITQELYPRRSFQGQCHPAGTVSRQLPSHHELYGPNGHPRHHSVQSQRYPVSNIGNGNLQETNELHRRKPPMQIDEALRTHCGIAADQFFVAAVTNDGTPMTFFSPGHKLQDGEIRQFFDATKFQRTLSKIDTGSTCTSDDPYDVDANVYDRSAPVSRNRAMDRRHSSAYEDGSNLPRQGRKRPRGPKPNNDDDIPMKVTSRRGIRIGDSEAVWNFYDQRFRDCHQTACRIIAKVFVKLVEPKKQSAHPYTGPEAPDWWPKPWGPAINESVRHIEPDHLRTPERVHLLCHILRMVAKPVAKQHPAIQKLGLNVRKLHESTVEMMSSFFSENESNANKKRFLNELFKVALQEERYLCGGLDQGATVYVMSDDKASKSFTSDNEDMPYIKEEDDYKVPIMELRATHGAGHPVTGDTGSEVNMRGGPFLGDLPVRGPPFAPPMLDMTSHSHSFTEAETMSVHGQTALGHHRGNLAMDVVTSPQATSRRPSMLSDYASPDGDTSMYTQQWQSSSNGQSASPMYAYATQPNSHASSFASQGMPMNPNQSFMAANSFEELPRSDYESHPSGMFGTEGLPQTPTNHHQGYGYMANEGRNL